MSAKLFFSLLAIVSLTAILSAQTYSAEKIPRIGYLAASSAKTSAARIAAFRQGLRELGYVEGKNITIEFRFADGNRDRLRQLAAELVKLNVDIIVSAGPTVTRRAKAATSTIPIVMGFDDDPVGSGFVTSLAQPGGNITGLSTLAPEISGKQLEILREIMPKISRIAVFGTSTRSGTSLALKEMELAAEAYKVKLQYLDVLEAKDIENAFRAAAKGNAEAVILLGSPVFNLRRTQIIDLAATNRMPMVYAQPEYVNAGGLMYYGANFTDIFRRAATYVDKIIKGRTPADLPVEQPMKFDFIVNLPAAKKIGLTIPPNVLVRANRVIR